MTDKELLELAAKAAGIRCITYENNYNGRAGLMQCDEHGRHTHMWSPLTDDGDALRLAVKLRIDLEFGQEDVTASVWTDTAYVGAFQEKHKATRRAIVRAAAELGKEMES